MQALRVNLPWPLLMLGWALVLPASYLLLVFLHEAGHVVGALLTRFQILSFNVSRLHISRRASGWQVRFRKPKKGLSGMVQVLASDSRNLRSRYALLLVGGPSANLLTGALALYAAYMWVPYSPPFPFTGYLLHYTLLVFGWMSVVIGTLNLLPLKLKSGHIIDGKHLLHLMQGGPAMHQQLAALQLSSLSHNGTRPRDWNATIVEKLLSNHSNSVLDCYAHYYAYCYYHDCNDLEAIRLHLNEALDRRHLAPVAFQQYILGEAAYVAALHTYDTEQARHWLNRAQEVKPYSKEEGLFARAAVAWAEGQLSEASTWLQAARQQLAESLDVGTRTQAAERMDELQVKIEQASLVAVSV